jgi:hypothetical protein
VLGSCQFSACRFGASREPRHTAQRATREEYRVHTKCGFQLVSGFANEANTCDAALVPNEQVLALEGRTIVSVEGD